jgi:hypothetical protein
MRTGTRGSPSWPGRCPQAGYVDADCSDRIAESACGRGGPYVFVTSGCLCGVSSRARASWGAAFGRSNFRRASADQAPALFRGIRIPAAGLQQGMCGCRHCDAKGKAVVSIRWAEAGRNLSVRHGPVEQVSPGLPPLPTDEPLAGASSCSPHIPADEPLRSHRRGAISRHHAGSHGLALADAW